MVTTEISLYGFGLGRTRPARDGSGAVIFWTGLDSLETLSGRHESHEKLLAAILVALTREQLAVIASRMRWWSASVHA